MTLAIDATTSAVTAGATSLDTTLNVGAGATGLLVALIFQGVNALPSGVSVHWDSTGTNQAMTQIRDDGSVDFNGVIQLWGLVNPTAGNHTLHAAWTTSVPAVMGVISFSGGVTTSVATAFINDATNA